MRLLSHPCFSGHWYLAHMALVACPECTNDVSGRASICPNCGYPIAAVAAGAATQIVADRQARRSSATKPRSTGHLVSGIGIGVPGWLLVVFGGTSWSLWTGIALAIVGVWLFSKWMKEPYEDFQRHLSIASDPDPDPNLLSELVSSPHSRVRMQVVLNPQVPVSALEILTTDSDADVSSEARNRLAKRRA